MVIFIDVPMFHQFHYSTTSRSEFKLSPDLRSSRSTSRIHSWTMERFTLPGFPVFLASSKLTQLWKILMFKIVQNRYSKSSNWASFHNGKLPESSVVCHCAPPRYNPSGIIVMSGIAHEAKPHFIHGPSLRT